MDQLNCNFLCSLFSKCNIHNIKIINFWQIIWNFQISTNLSPSVPEISCISARLRFFRNRLRDVVGRVPAFQPGGPGSIPGGVRNFNFCPGIGCVSFVCVLSCVVSGGGPDIVLTIQSGRPPLVSLSCSGPKTVAPPTGIWCTGIWVVSPGGVSTRFILNPWPYSSEEPRPTEVVAVRWQYTGLVVRKALIPQP